MSNKNEESTILQMYQRALDSQKSRTKIAYNGGVLFLVQILKSLLTVWLCLKKKMKSWRNLRNCLINTNRYEISLKQTFWMFVSLKLNTASYNGFSYKVGPEPQTKPRCKCFEYEDIFTAAKIMFESFSYQDLELGISIGYSEQLGISFHDVVVFVKTILDCQYTQF